MHYSAHLKAELFIETYCRGLKKGPEKLKVLDIGSKSYEEQSSNRDIFDPELFHYIGLDLEAGLNVDLVPRSVYLWDEIESQSFDICSSSQTFEHNPYFWITFAEIARILKPGELMFLAAPGAGAVHRFPYDCWRFYPDGWLGLCALTGMELLESYFEDDHTAMTVPGGGWRDSILIARRPHLSTDAEASFYRQLEKITAPVREGAPNPGQLPSVQGPFVTDYRERVAQDFSLNGMKELRRRIKGKNTPAILEPSKKAGVFRALFDLLRN